MSDGEHNFDSGDASSSDTIPIQVMAADRSSCEVSLLTPESDTKDDMFLPHKEQSGVAPEQVDTDTKLAKEIFEAVEKGITMCGIMGYDS